MTALANNLLRSARAAGVTVLLRDGDRITLRALAPPSPDLVVQLRPHKADLVAALRARASARPSAAASTAANSTEPDWLESYAESAAFRQYEAGFRRDVAERLAFGEVIETWCRRHPHSHDPAVCASCGRPLAADVLDLPDGGRVHWARRREFACLIAAGLRRKERAVAALAGMGLTPPGGWQTT